jgi:hypothetical protein
VARCAAFILYLGRYGTFASQFCTPDDEFSAQEDHLSLRLRRGEDICMRHAAKWAN